MVNTELKLEFKGEKYDAVLRVYIGTEMPKGLYQAVLNFYNYQDVDSIYLSMYYDLLYKVE